MRFQKVIGWLLPIGTTRRQFYDLCFLGLRVLTNEGWRSFWQNFINIAYQVLSRKGLLSLKGPHLLFRIKEDISIHMPDPLLSVVILEDNFNENSLVSLYGSLAHQTLNSLEIVSYSEKKGQINIMKNSKYDQRDIRECGSLIEMRDQLAGQYIFTPTQDFIQFSETFLESNVLALASENLLFTINFFGVPGDSFFVQTSTDLLQDILFVHKDLASFETSKFSIFELKKAIENAAGKVAGRWVIQPHIENYNANIISLSDAFDIADIELFTIDRHIIPKPSNVELPASIEHIITPLDNILYEKTRINRNPVVLVFMQFLAVGGAEKLTFDVLNNNKDRFDFVIVTSDIPDASIGEQTNLFRKITPYIYHMAAFGVPPLFLSTMSYLVQKFDIKTLFVANGSSWFYNEVVNMKKAFPHLKIINQVYDHQRGWINRLSPQVCDAVDFHIAVNRSIEKNYRDKRGIPDEKIRLIHHGIDLEEFDHSKFDERSKNEIRNRLELPENRLIVSFIARFHPQKRPVDFIRLAKRMEHDRRFFFLMVGDGPLRDEVSQFIRLNNLSNLKRLPFYEPIIDILSLIDILLITSEYEGLPLILLEAQSMAVPVISTNVGCNAEVITTGENGFIINKIGDIEAFEKALLTFAGLEDRKAWGLRGRERVAMDFNIEKVAHTYGNLFGDN